MSELTGKLHGTWSYVSWVYKNSEGQTIDYLDEHTIGTLTYTSKGMMSVQIMLGQPKRIVVGEMLEDNRETDHDPMMFVAYFGTYNEKEPGVLAHQVEGSNVSNWVGKTNLRKAVIKEDQLILSAQGLLSDGEKVLFEVSWRKAD